ncbi:MAG: DUF488 domain-containing protein [Candidatus Sulfotelmatobacter sp.]
MLIQLNRLQIKRVYDAVSPTDGARLLVERLWPRGIKKSSLKIDGWLRDVAPSTNACPLFLSSQPRATARRDKDH